LLAEAQSLEHDRGFFGGDADRPFAALLKVVEAAPDPETGVGGEAIALGGIELLRRPHQVESSLLERIGGGVDVGRKAGAMATPGVGDQAEVVTDQLFAGAQCALADGLGGMAWATGVLLPALDAAGEFEHGALTQGPVTAAAAQPVGHGTGLVCGMGLDCHSDAGERQLLRGFPAIARLRALLRVR